MKHELLPRPSDKLEIADKLGYELMGPNFNVFVSDIRSHKLACTIIKARLNTKNNNVMALADVAKAKDLATIEAGLIVALGVPDSAVAAIIPSCFGFDEATMEEMSSLGRIFGDYKNERAHIDNYSQQLSRESKSMLLFAPRDSLPQDVQEKKFGYIWNLKLSLKEATWQVGEATSIKRF